MTMTTERPAADCGSPVTRDRKPTVGSICSGYGGLEMAVSEMWGADLRWYAENDPHASEVLVHHWGSAPNLGDITAVDWAEVDRVDVLAAGFPCTDISNAGKREGIEGKRSGVWANVAEAVGVLRPPLVLLENVAAIRSRGLDTVIRDLAQRGYAVRWTCAKASTTVNAPHPRNRWFAAAVPVSDKPLPGWDVVSRSLPSHGEFVQGAVREMAYEATAAGSLARLPSPADADAVRLLPTPAARDWKSCASNLIGTNSRPLNEIVVKLPTAPSNDGWVGVDGADYGPAVRRWEGLMGRPAPAPSDTGPRGGRRAAAGFVEWLMGLPEGHVTACGIPRNEQMKILGNGVVPQQAVHAYRALLPDWSWKGRLLTPAPAALAA